jgi:hypothetical protein
MDNPYTQSTEQKIQTKKKKNTHTSIDFWLVEISKSKCPIAQMFQKWSVSKFEFLKSAIGLGDRSPFKIMSNPANVKRKMNGQSRMDNPYTQSTEQKIQTKQKKNTHRKLKS